MFSDIKAIFDRDPAAGNIFEVLMYQGLWAVLIHRLSHMLYWLRIPVLPRLVSQIGRLFTQIEIHPGAKIGKGFFIDHGAGVVIGETVEIGKNVTIYQGVTLGGTGKQKGKRHPTVGDNVVIGAGAIILGAITLGEGSRIGAGSVVTKSVPPHSTVVGNPGRIVRMKGKSVGALEHGALPDPVARALEDMKKRISSLEQKIK